MKREIGIVVAIVTASIVLPATTAPPALAAEQPVSAGCAALNGPSFDGSYLSQTLPDAYFLAGETISATASTPPSGSNRSVSLEFPLGVVVDSAPSPGSVSYEVQVNGEADVRFSVSVEGANATWTVECVPAPPRTLSSGCDNVNSPSADRPASSGGAIEGTFHAGEMIVVTASPPSNGSATLLTLELFLIPNAAGVVVDTAAFPGTVTYTVPADGSRTMMYSLNVGATAMLTVACQGAPPPMSAGCNDVNNQRFVEYRGASEGPSFFFAGETITVGAFPPSSGSPTTVRLEFPVGTVVDTAPFPGTVSYVVPTDGESTVLWSLDRGTATFVPHCEPAPARPLSEGCRSLNAPGWDFFYASGFTDVLPFAAGETVVVSAVQPSAGDPTQVILEVPQGTVVDTAPFPGTASYTIPVGGTFAVEWRPDDGDVTWTVACRGALPPPSLCFGPPIGGPHTIFAKPGVVTVGTSGPDFIVGTSGNDRIAGMGGDDIVFGLDGNDQLAGGDGADVVCGGAGTDTLSGGAGPDQLVGDVGNDDLAGDVGDDQLFGGPGLDRLVGGQGSDTCLGGAEPTDTFVACESLSGT
jgi:hypothetical protein